jgi:hypothetical protein
MASAGPSKAASSSAFWEVNQDVRRNLNTNLKVVCHLCGSRVWLVSPETMGFFFFLFCASPETRLYLCEL